MPQYTKKDKEILKQRAEEETQEGEQDPMMMEDMPDPDGDVEIKVEKYPDGGLCIKVMQSK